MTSTRNTGLVCASILAASAALLPIGQARAQTTFGVIQAFGDSYADTGNLFKILGVPNPVQYPTGRFSGGTNFVDTTASLLGISQNNFAIGGATSSAHLYGLACDFTIPGFGTPEQICKRLTIGIEHLGIDQLIWEYDSWVHMGLSSGEPRYMALTINNNGTETGFA